VDGGTIAEDVSREARELKRASYLARINICDKVN
jgi:hypothetical protein